MVHRFVLRFEGDSAMPQKDVQRIRGLPGVNVIAETPKMLLAESDEQPLRELVDALPSWIMAQETTYGHGDPRPRIRPEESA